MKRLPKDELDHFWDNAFGFLPAIILLFAGIGPLFASKSTISVQLSMISLVIGLSVFVFTIYSKLTERKTKLIKTGLDKNLNENLIHSLASNENWRKLSRVQDIHSYLIPFGNYHWGFKLTLIPAQEGIRINLRNRGSVIGRMPYHFGIETIKLKRIKKKIQNYAQQRL